MGVIYIDCYAIKIKLNKIRINFGGKIMKLRTKKIIAIFLATISAICLISCKGGSDIRNDQSEQESVDITKTQLNVGFYYAGLGKDWIQEAKTLFEEKYAESEKE